MSEVNCMNCIVAEFREDLCEEEFCEKFRCARGNKDFIEHVLEVARPHGEWVYDEKSNVYRCSRCRHFPSRIITEKDDIIFTDFSRSDSYIFCPHCGSDNRKVG